MENNLDNINLENNPDNINSENNIDNINQVNNINNFIRIRDNIQENLTEDLNNLLNINTRRYVHFLGLLFILINRNISVNFIEEHFQTIIDLFYMYYNDFELLKIIIIDFIVLYRMNVSSNIIFDYLRNYRFE